MELLIIWLALSGAVGIAASRRYDRSGFGWFILAVLFSPVLAFIFLLAFGPRKAESGAGARSSSIVGDGIAKVAADEYTR
jgi:hypothetical protein